MSYDLQSLKSSNHTLCVYLSGNVRVTVVVVDAFDIGIDLISKSLNTAISRIGKYRFNELSF